MFPLSSSPIKFPSATHTGIRLSRQVELVLIISFENVISLGSISSTQPSEHQAET